MLGHRHPGLFHLGRQRRPPRRQPGIQPHRINQQLQPLLTVLEPDPVIGQSRHGSIDHSHQGRIIQLLEGQLHASNATHRP